jgi:site-specific DNA recombinase
MQRRRGTNHADWYFFTCLTNNRVGADRCTGMYIREEDIFSAIYHQLKIFFQTPDNSIYQRKQNLEQLRRKLTEQIEFQQKIAENPMMHYEKYILGEISIDEFRASQDKIHQMVEDQKALEFEIEKCDRACQHLLCMCEVRDKQLPLSAILDEIKTITVNAGRKIVVHWR